MTTIRLILLLFFGANLACFSQSKSSSITKRTYTTKAIGNQKAPSIDGQLNDVAWELVEWTSDYLEFQPDVGTPPTEQTKMKILYDEKNLYVAFKCYQTDPSTIEKRMGRRDDFPGDWVEINLDSYNDDRTAFSFTISASGVKGDEFVSNNGNFDTSWNPIWYTKTQIDEEGWTAEMRIPLSQLRFGNEEEQTWGLQSTRRYFNNEERSTWQPLEANPPGWVSEFGELRGLIGLKPQKQLEIQPYTVAQLNTYEAQPGNPFRDGSDTRLTGGLDAKIGITNDLTLDLTINPDFGQVDADPGAIALDGFEIFFQERRPFFVENKNVFDFRLGGGSDNLFFSRRIGRTPQGFTTVRPGLGEYDDIPNFSTILGAAKFSGKTKDGWAIGILESITAKEFAEVKLDEREEVIDNLATVGDEREELVEPFTNYLVTRVQKDFNDRNSYIGGIFTAVNRKLEGNLDFLHKSAYSGGVDFKHNWKNRTYYVEGNLSVSTVNGSEEAISNTQRSITHLFQRVDADYLDFDPNKTSLTGTGGALEVGKGGNGNWNYNLGLNWKSPELELNDIGFLRQADDIRQFLNVRRFFNKPTNWYRRAELSYELSNRFDFGGHFNRTQHEFKGNVNFANNWFFDTGFGHIPRTYSNAFLRGGPRWQDNQENFGYWFVGTDQRKKFSTVLGYVHLDTKEDVFQLRRYEMRFRYQPLNALSMSLNLQYEQSPTLTQYVGQASFEEANRYILGTIDNESLSATLRLNYNINPDLTIQYYGQPFIFKANFSDYKFVNQADADSVNDRVLVYNDDQISQDGNTFNVDEDRNGSVDYSFGNPDFAFVQFRSNLVLRWEYIPGSEIFLVWSQGITGLGDVNNDFGRIIDHQLLKQRPENTFLLKATYRFAL